MKMILRISPHAYSECWNTDYPYSFSWSTEWEWSRIGINDKFLSGSWNRNWNSSVKTRRWH